MGEAHGVSDEDVPGDDVPEYDRTDPTGDRAPWYADPDHREEEDV